MAGHAFAQLSVSISPSATPDPLTSIKVSASLTGVLAGATVVRFNVWRDFNANGNVDAGEPLLASYDVPNNGDYKIGGVRNDNRPWDLNPSVSVVQAEVGRGIFNLINIWAGDFVVTAAKTTTPTSQVRASFKLALPAKNQRIRGTVRDNSGAVVPRNAIVVFERLDSPKISLVSTDSAGAYDAPLDAGEYQVEVHSAMGNVYEDYPKTTSKTISLRTNAIVTNNATLKRISTSRPITGVVLDFAGNPLRGVLLEANNSATQRRYLTFTGQNGEFSMPVDGGTWELEAKLGLSALGLVGYDDALTHRSAIINNSAGAVANTQPIVATPANAMLKFLLRASDNRSMDGLGLSFYNSHLDADFRISGGSVCIASVAGAYTLDIDWGDEGFINPDSTDIELKVGTTPVLGPFTIDVADLRIRGRFLAPQGTPIPSVRFYAKTTNYQTIAEARIRGDGTLRLNLGSGEPIFLTQRCGTEDPVPTHVFFGPWLTNGLQGDVNLGDVRGIPLAQKVRATPVDGKTGAVLTGSRLSRALAPGLWISADLYGMDFGVLWGSRQISNRGGPDDIRLNDTNRLSLIKSVLSEQNIQNFFNSNPSAANYAFIWPSSLRVPTNTPTRLGRTEFDNRYNSWASYPHGTALEQSIPAGGFRSFYEFPVALLTNHPLLNASYGGFNWGFNYDGSSAVKNLVICSWNSLPLANSANKFTNGVLNWKMPVRDVSYSNAIHVTYVDASGKRIGGKWIGYSADEWNDVDLNRDYHSSMNYSGGSTTGIDGKILFPAYNNTREWRITDWEASPLAVAYVTAKPGINQVILRRTTNAPTSQGTVISAAGRSPGGIITLTGPAMEVVGGDDGFALCATNNDYGGFPLRVVGRTYATNATGSSTVQLGIPSAVPAGTYRIKMNPRHWSMNTNIFTANFLVAGSGANNIVKSGSNIRITGKYFSQGADIVFKRSGMWQTSEPNPNISDDGTTINLPVPTLATGTYQIFYSQGGVEALLGNLSL